MIGHITNAILTFEPLQIPSNLSGGPQLGNGQFIDSFTFQPITLHGDKILDIQCGEAHCFALTLRGLYAWGSNFLFQLGLGTRQDSAIPTLVSLPPNVIPSQVSGGSHHSLLLGKSAVVDGSET